MIQSTTDNLLVVSEIKQQCYEASAGIKFSSNYALQKVRNPSNVLLSIKTNLNSTSLQADLVTEWIETPGQQLKGPGL